MNKNLSPKTHLHSGQATKAFNQNISETLKNAKLPYEIPVNMTRELRREGKGIIPIGGPIPGSEWLHSQNDHNTAPNIRISKADSATKGTFLHIHGGGWTFGSPDQFDVMAQRIAAETGLEVLSVQYRLAPEHPWPAQLEDCLAAARWMLKYREGPFFIGGESAGAHLAAMTLLSLREEGLHRAFRGVVFNYGAFDLDLTPSASAWGDEYLILSTPIIEWFVGNMMGDRPRRPASPLWFPLHDMPPALFQIGTADPLLDDSLFMAARWAAVGNSADLALYEDGIHAFDCFDLEIARAAHQRQDAFVRDLL